MLDFSPIIIYLSSRLPWSIHIITRAYFLTDLYIVFLLFMWVNYYIITRVFFRKRISSLYQQKYLLISSLLLNSPTPNDSNLLDIYNVIDTCDLQMIAL